jgi:hypothetical protein
MQIPVYKNLLISEAILNTAIRARPGDPVAGHAPLIFIHACLANGKPASTLPAEHKFFLAAMTNFIVFLPAFFPTGTAFFHHHINILLLFLKR